MSKAGMDALKGAMEAAMKEAAQKTKAQQGSGKPDDALEQIVELGATILAAASAAMEANFHSFIEIPMPDGRSFGRFRITAKLEEIRPDPSNAKH